MITQTKTSLRRPACYAHSAGRGFGGQATWQRMKFKDFADTSPSVKLERGKEYPFIPMDVVDGKHKFPLEVKRKSFSGGGSKFANGDTVFARITPCLENGKIAMVKGLEEGIGFGSTEFFVFRGKDGVSDSDFVYYLSRTDTIRDPAVKSMVGASGRQRADKTVVDNVRVLAPSLSQQKQIADVLSAYDDLIENNTKRIKILEQIAQAIYKEWFIENSKIKNQKAKLSEVVKPQYGYTESAQNKPVGPKYLRGMDINKTSYIDWSTVPYCEISDEDKKKYQLKKGDIVVIRMADPGKIGIVEQDVNAIFASYLIRLKITDDRISPYYLFYFFILSLARNKTQRWYFQNIS